MRRVDGLEQQMQPFSATLAEQIRRTGQLEQVTSGREASDKMLLVIMRPFLLP